MKVSKYLTYEEATKSPTAKRLGIENKPTKDHLENMRRVAINVFDKVREHFSVPIGVSSFYRSQELNDAVPGSSKTSQHRTGEAIDIDADIYGNVTNLDIFNYIKDNLVFDQLIGEYPDASGKWSWVHVSLKKSGNRKQVLVKLKDKYIPYDQFKVGMV